MYWKRILIGVLIGAVIGLIIGIFSIFPSIFPWAKRPPYSFISIIFMILSYPMLIISLYHGVFFYFIITILFYGFLGALVGWIYSKTRKKRV
jgi:hypothetical protein